jgi:hypothetical protein
MIDETQHVLQLNQLLDFCNHAQDTMSEPTPTLKARIAKSGVAADDVDKMFEHRGRFWERKNRKNTRRLH